MVRSKCGQVDGLLSHMQVIHLVKSLIQRMSRKVS